MNLRAGSKIGVTLPQWPADMHEDDRTGANASWYPALWTVISCEWLPPHQRLVVRVSDGLHELLLTPHELRLNGAL